MKEVQLFPLTGPIQRILVMRPRALGDLLLATPALRALKQGFPQAELHAAVDDTLAPILRRNPSVDRLWLFPRRRPRRRGEWPRLYRNLRRQRFDLVLDLHGSPRTAMLARFTGARHRIGYALRLRGRFYTIRVPRDSDRRGRPARQYAAQVNLDLVARCGVAGPAVNDPSLVYVADPPLDQEMGRRLDTLVPRRPRIGIAAAGTWQAKTYPPELYARVADALVEAGCAVLLLWGPGERGIAEGVRQAMRQPAVLAPETDLETLASLLVHLDLLVGNDSGVKHLAVARGTPTLTLFGPTSPRTWMPTMGEHAWLRAGLPCVECDLTRCAHHLCMRLLPPEAVTTRALQHLRQRKRPQTALSGMELPETSG